MPIYSTCGFWTAEGNYDSALSMFDHHYGKDGYAKVLCGQGSQVITEGFRTYTTKIETPFKVWQAIATGEISGETALFERQYKVLGDFDLMLKWGELFSGADTAKKPVSAANTHKTNMAAFLLPWMAIWIFLAINPRIGAIISNKEFCRGFPVWLVFLLTRNPFSILPAN